VKYYRLICFLCGLTCLVISNVSCQTAQRYIRGQVLDESGSPVAGASVNIQGTTNKAWTDNKGEFSLGGLPSGVPVTVSAWSEGYYCAKSERIVPPAAGITLTLRLYQTTDNPDYEWIPPVGENSCYSCKPGVTQVWLDNDAHSGSALNLRYLTMYTGTDVHGNQSLPTRYAFIRDYGSIPLPPDSSLPYFGPGYRLDFPATTGNCATCHNPGAAVDSPYGTDPAEVTGVDLYGIHCDYCHKVAAVRLDPATGMPYPNRPGVLSQDIRRPFPEDEARYQLFFGSFVDDNVPEEDTYLPLIQQSQFCAPCHFGIFWDTLVYNSFGEWLESPYSDPDAGMTCQECHMPVPTLLDGVAITNVAPGKGGIERDPLAIAAHTFPGASSQDLLENTVTMSVQAERAGGQVSVSVTLLNDRAGHHVPTDSPLRQMILLVQAKGPEGQPLDLLAGPTLPDWAGIGDQADGYYAGVPGVGYAKILMELWTEVTPTGAYWNPTRVVSDNRIPALGSHTSHYIFSAPSGDVRIEVGLIYRRAFISLADQKGWEVPDILMDAQAIELSMP
jgi:hypothetical protein